MLGEPLYLSKEIEEMAEEMQESHREMSGKEGMIRDFLEREIPADWVVTTCSSGGSIGTEICGYRIMSG